MALMRMQNGPDCGCRWNWNGKRGHGVWMAGNIRGAIPGINLNVVIIRTKGMKRRALFKIIQATAARWECTRCPGMYGSGARIGIIQKHITVIDKAS